MRHGLTGTELHLKNMEKSVNVTFWSRKLGLQSQRNCEKLEKLWSVWCATAVAIVAKINNLRLSRPLLLGKVDMYKMDCK